MRMMVCEREEPSLKAVALVLRWSLPMLITCSACSALSSVSSLIPST
jgi:hypothetical protein